MLQASIRPVAAVWIALSTCVQVMAAEPQNTAAETTISPPQGGEHGMKVHEVRSPYQAGTTDIRVLLPEQLDDSSKLRVIYVLPVEPGRETNYADGLTEIARHGWHNQYGAAFVAPTFSHIPWYADHPSDQAKRQETYLLQVVIPFIEQTYPVSTAADHCLLLGFSKSGWGAWCLLLRHPEMFGRASAWDAPVMMAEPGRYRSAEILIPGAHFEQYHLSRLLRQRADDLQGEPRLILTGYGNFRDQHEQMHALLEELNIPHVYRDGPQREHSWSSGWMLEAIELLLK